MRRLTVITAFLLFAGFSYGQLTKMSSADIKAEEEALNKLMDKFNSAIEAYDVSTMLSLYTDDAFMCGTDPSEFWTKQEFAALWEQGPSDASPPEFKYINDRKIILAPGGKSAIVVTQYIISWSPNIPWRQVYHCVKINDNWLIHFLNVAFIPENEDIQKLNEAISK